MSEMPEPQCVLLPEESRRGSRAPNEDEFFSAEREEVQVVCETELMRRQLLASNLADSKNSAAEAEPHSVMAYRRFPNRWDKLPHNEITPLDEEQKTASPVEEPTNSIVKEQIAALISRPIESLEAARCVPLSVYAESYRKWALPD